METDKNNKSEKTMIAYCGLDCARCDAYIATVNDDNSLRKKTAELWSELNEVPILPEHINCEGCLGDGVKTVFCDSICGIRRCAVENGVSNCGKCVCVDGCETLGMITANNPETLKNLGE